MNEAESFVGTKGWLGVGAFVIAWDILADETLSNAFKRGREHTNPMIKAATIGGLAVTVAHLMDVIPERIDPFDNFNKAVGKIILALDKPT